MGCYAYLTGGLEGGAGIYHHDLWRYSLLDDCGCTDPEAVNYSVEATTDDGTCCYVAGCMLESAVNYNPDACQGDGSCIAAILGCTDPSSPFFEPEANTESALGGPLSSTALGAGGYHFNDNWDMLFSVSEPTVLASVDVLAETNFSIDVYIRDAGGNTLFQEPFALSTGWNTLEINVEIPNGTDFVIGIDGTNDGLFRNNAVPEGEFPVGVADRMSITSNTTDSPLDYFYYFYRWVVESPCAEPTGISTPDPAFSVHPNPTSGALTLSGLTQGDWVSVLNPLGREVHGAQVNQAQTVLNLSGLPSGLYLLQAGTEKSVRVILRD